MAVHGTRLDQSEITVLYVKELTGLLEEVDGLGELVGLLYMTPICYWSKTETSGLYVTKLADIL
jgi:hypothetical protein